MDEKITEIEIVEDDDWNEKVEKEGLEETASNYISRPDFYSKLVGIGIFGGINIQSDKFPKRFTWEDRFPKDFLLTLPKEENKFPEGFPEFRIVPEETLKAFGNKSTIYDYPPGTKIYWQGGDIKGNPNTKLHFVIEGNVRIIGEWSDKRPVHYRNAMAGDPLESMFGELEALRSGSFLEGLGSPNLATAQVDHVKARVVQIEYRDFLLLEQQDAALLYNMQEWLVRRIYTNLIIPFRSQDAAKRLLDEYVLNLAKSKRGKISENGELPGAVMLSDLLEHTGGISRQRLHELLKTAQMNDEYEFDGHHRKLKLLPKHMDLLKLLDKT